MGSMLSSTTITVIVKGMSRDKSRIEALVETRAEIEGSEDIVVFLTLSSTCNVVVLGSEVECGRRLQFGYLRQMS
jgi:hypothetical protein